MDSILNYDHPFVCSDAVIFSIHSYEPDSYRKLPVPKLCVALYKREETPYKDFWCLPGGFLNIDETPEENIKRNILKKVSIYDCYLEQLYTFSQIDRDPRARTISISYLGLIPEEQSHKLDCNWFDIDFKDNNLQFVNNDLFLTEKNLGFDHADIIRYAVERLRTKITYSDVIFHLLPERFTLTQYQNAYEAITDEKQQTANFRRKIIGSVEITNDIATSKGHRPAKFYKKRNVK